MVAKQAAGALNVIRCTVGGAVVGFDLTRVVSVERGDRVVPCPSVPGALGRIANRAGEWVVYPLAWWFGREPGDARGGRVVLFETPRGRFGLAVDRVSPSVRVERDRISPPPRAAGFVAGGVLAGVAVLAGGPLVLLDPDRLDPSAPDLGEPPARRTRTRAQQPVSGGAPGQRLLAIACECHLGPAGRPVALCLPSANVVEIIALGAVAPVPTGEEHVCGVIAWRGRPVPVLDPARWLGLTNADRFATRGVVANVGGARVALAAGTDVRLIPASVPVVPTRRHFPVRLERTLGVFDATAETLVVPDWEQLVS